MSINMGVYNFLEYILNWMKLGKEETYYYLKQIKNWKIILYEKGKGWKLEGVDLFDFGTN